MGMKQPWQTAEDARNAGFIRQGGLQRGVLPDKSGVPVVLTCALQRVWLLAS